MVILGYLVPLARGVGRHCLAGHTAHLSSQQLGDGVRRARSSRPALAA